ncbi:MAG TPA: hypothetical protein VLV83_09510 [Acidobacteriota bacterium]|nr:hypothetical protein [Acidobacteriota bacterium]
MRIRVLAVMILALTAGLGRSSSSRTFGELHASAGSGEAEISRPLSSGPEIESAITWLASAQAAVLEMGPVSGEGSVEEASSEGDQPAGGLRAAVPQMFVTSDRCMACHNNLTSPDGQDVSIGADWRASMMANSARDPYWQAAVRREVLDHPMAQAAIEDECSKCHMPMARTQAHAQGVEGQIFAHLPVRQLAQQAQPSAAALAADGVSCAVCHQIRQDKLGTRESMVGGFVIDQAAPMGQREIFGPFEVDEGRRRIMNSASRFLPVQSSHIQSSELCATCHTLYTHTLDEQGQVIGELPEQVPYQEWLHSAYRKTKSCQSCHMPVVEEEMPITSVWGQPREHFSRHVFRGGNFFMMRMLNRYRDELGVQALPQELDTAARRTVEHLETSAARVEIAQARLSQGRLEATVRIENLAGHKLPTAYPSRRVWIHFSVMDAQSQTVFESGRFNADGSIEGNDNDANGGRYEPHYERVDSPQQVQIYEAVMVDPQERVTTGLLTALRFIKDNRVLPDGFDKATAGEDISVKGAAADDQDFQGGGDEVLYSIPVNAGGGPFSVRAQLWYQPIAYRWAHNLSGRQSMETERFVAYYKSMSDTSATVLARASAEVR